MSAPAQVVVQGTVAPGFEAVREEFQRNFAQRGELGAACAVYRRGQCVVDLWGASAIKTLGNPGRKIPWCWCFPRPRASPLWGSRWPIHRACSTTMNGWRPIGRNLLQNGKANVTVRQLLSHQARVCAIDEPLNLETLADPDKVAAAIAKQKPAWEPGTRHGYHGISLGWYESELVRRVDPQHRTIGKFFQDEVARPLDVEFYIGLPETIPPITVSAHCPL